jgi:squalene-associated FAD-dependent desaturase
MAYLDQIGARNRLSGPPSAAFPFMDIADGTRWTIRPNKGPIPWWVLSRRRGVPGAGLVSYLQGLRLLLARSDESVADILPQQDTLYRRLWEPLTVAALNAAPEEASAALMKPVLLETFARGAGACRPLIATRSLAETFIDPALALLERRQVDVRFGARVQGLTRGAGRIGAIRLADSTIELEEGDLVILAVPSWDASSLVPGLTAPPAGDPIVNVHFRLPQPPKGAGAVELLGVVGGFAQWIFVRDDIVSITISAAREQAQMEAGDIAARCWEDVRKALGFDHAMPPYRVVKEKRATHSQSPETAAHRPDPETVIANLLLAGDWTDTGLPATIEGAIRSGNRAAGLAGKALKGNGP